MCVSEPVKLVYEEVKKVLQDPKKTKVYSTVSRVFRGGKRQISHTKCTVVIALGGAFVDRQQASLLLRP